VPVRRGTQTPTSAVTPTGSSTPRMCAAEAVSGACIATQHATMIITMAEAYPSNPPPPPPRPVRPPGALDLGRGAWVRPQDLEWTYTTARGPGGQHVNKASTAAVLRVRVAAIGGLDDAAIDRLRTIASAVWVGEGELLYRCDLHRSQLQNKDACEARLKTLVSQAAARPKVRKKTKPTWGSVKRRLEGKKKDSARKQSRRWDGD